MGDTLRSQNACASCGNTWYPRGKELSSRCPGCGSEAVTFARRSPPPDYDDSPPPPDNSANSCGIGAIALGAVAIPVSLIPCLGVISLPLSGLGAILAVTGFFLSISRGGRGLGFSIAGGALSGFALAIGLFWLHLANAAHAEVERANAEQRKKNDEAQARFDAQKEKARLAEEARRKEARERTWKPPEPKRVEPAPKKSDPEPKEKDPEPPPALPMKDEPPPPKKEPPAKAEPAPAVALGEVEKAKGQRVRVQGLARIDRGVGKLTVELRHEGKPVAAAIVRLADAAGPLAAARAGEVWQVTLEGRVQVQAGAVQLLGVEIIEARKAD